MQCVALFPGAFRPPHEAHLAAVHALAADPGVDRVVVIIAGRSRRIPGTSKALDAGVASRIWQVYLRTVPKARIEIAAHDAISHALSFFARVAPGSRLKFCIGESDFAAGDSRFNEIHTRSEQTGIHAVVIPAPTGSITVRATGLREALALGEAGREAFLAELPPSLSEAERCQVWNTARGGMREIHEIVEEKIRSQIQGIHSIECVSPGKADPVFRARLGARTVYIKYAGDTVEAGRIGCPLDPKPRKRLSVEQRVIKRLKGAAVELPEVVRFDKETLTLVLSEVCPGGQSLQSQGTPSTKAIADAARFLAACHAMRDSKPLWEDEAGDRRHWRAILEARIPDPALRAQCDAASRRGLFHLNLSPAHIRTCGNTTGIVDLELCSTVGDPAFDLAYLLGHLPAPLRRIAIEAYGGEPAMESRVNAVASVIASRL